MTQRHFDISLGCLISPAVDELAAQLSSFPGLSAREGDIITSATRGSLQSLVHSKLSRLLILELNAARVTGRLRSKDSKEGWEQFLQLSSEQSFWDDLAVHYPTLLSRIGAIVRNRCRATLRFAQRWSTDRGRLAGLCGGEPGELQEVSFGAGDSHCGGSTVAVLSGEGWRVVYKPRSLAIDRALRDFVGSLAENYGSALNIRVPHAVESADCGWVEFIEHRYAAGTEELLNFYRGIGHWLAVMRLLGGSDLHAENLIAHGESPVVVDCETLFTPRIPASPSGYGAALDRASEMLTGSVLRVGLLPQRGIGLGWRGVDSSALGMLPGQQPMQMQQEILDAGSGEARINTILVEAPISQNHPSAQPALALYWPEVLRGFDGLTATLRRLDATGKLRARLRAFEDCRIRVVPRATEVYAELGRMLWHPVSLHNPDAQRKLAFALLQKMAANVASAPSDPAVINAELDDLLEGDIPYFSALVREGHLSGPRGTHWLPACHLLEAALANWRSADFALEKNVIQTSLVSAYLNEGWKSARTSLLPKHGAGGDLEARRRGQVAKIVRRIMTNAISGEDGSVAWIAPVLTPSGWSVQPLQPDLYNGISGIAILFGAYLRETVAGHVEPLAGLDKLFAAALHTLHLAEAKRERERAEGRKTRPPTPGCYLGLGSQIWTYLVLAHWQLDGGDSLHRACRLAEGILDAVAVDDTNDLFSGTAGAIAPLLMLARKTNDQRYVEMALRLGDLLHERAKHRNGHAYWVHSRWPEGIGGFAHGVTGIGWAVTLLARATDTSQHEQLAREAFAFEDALFDEQEQNWLDLRMLEGVKTAAAWCHGAVGIGLAHVNLDPTLIHASTRQLLNRAAAATWRLGMGLNHCACHGDLGAWELLNRAISAGEGPKKLSAEGLLDLILTSLEKYGACFGVSSGNAFTPGLLPGLAGVAYQLLRAHPEHDLPSFLTPSGEEL